MQQTDKYKLNKPGVDDPIAIAPLNENADKIEAALLTKASAAETGQQFAALAQRVTALEVHKIVVGSYTGTGNPTTIDLGFTPAAMIVAREKTDSVDTDPLIFLLTPENYPVHPFSGPLLKLTEGGFSVDTYTWNTAGKKHYFLALV
mgnify:CR=1 FL=1